MIQGRVDRKEAATGRGRRAGKGWEWGGVLEAGRVDRKEEAGRGIWQRGGGQREVGDGGPGDGVGAKGTGRRMARLRGILQMDMMECLGGHRL